MQVLLIRSKVIMSAEAFFVLFSCSGRQRKSSEFSASIIGTASLRSLAPETASVGGSIAQTAIML